MAGGERLPKDPIQNYTDAHWGLAPTKKITIDDDLLPEHLVEIGKLLSIKLLRGQNIEFGPRCRLAYTPSAPTRLYCVLSKVTKRRLQQTPWNHEGVNLRDLAKHIGGYQATHRMPYPNLQVLPLGIVHNALYRTEKGKYLPDIPSDGRSAYIHKHGDVEEAPWGDGIRPALALDALGNLWFAGGDYRVLRGGISG